MAKLNGTILASRIVPSDSLDAYATHDADYGRGGYRSVADITERDAITEPRRKQGMQVYVNSENKLYMLVDGITNSDWVEVVFGGSTQTPAEIKTAYESNADTNAFTDALKTKLEALEAPNDGENFDPSLISGCQLWMDSSDDEVVTENGSGEITEWLDKSPNPKTNTILNAPTRSTLPSGMKSIYFDGATDYSQTQMLTFGTQLADALSGKSGYSAFYVYRSFKDRTQPPENLTGNDASQIVLDIWGGQTFTRLRHNVHEGYAPYEIVRDNGANSVTRVVGEYDMPENTMQIVDARASIPNQTFAVRVNGEEQNWTQENMSFTEDAFEVQNGSFGAETGKISVDTIGGNGYLSGGSAGTLDGYNPFHGDIAEIILYDRRLTTSQQIAVRQYLANKWGVEVASGNDATDGLNELGDVTLESLKNEDILQYNTDTSQFENKIPLGLVRKWQPIVEYYEDQIIENEGTLYKCTTYHESAATFSDTNWTSLSGSGGTTIDNLDDVSDVNVPSPSDGDVLTYDNANSEWIASTPSGGTSDVSEISDLDDVDSGTPSDGDVLTWNDTNSQWESAAPTGGSGGGATELDDLTDVNIGGTLLDGHALVYDDVLSKFKNAKVNINDIGGVVTTGARQNTFLIYDDVSETWKPNGTLDSDATPAIDLPRMVRTGNNTESITPTTNMPYKTEVEDSHDAWDDTEDCYVLPYDGFYHISASAITTTYQSWYNWDIMIDRDDGNGYVLLTRKYREYSADGPNETFMITGEAGDKIALRYNWSKTLVDNPDYHRISIVCLAQKQNIVLENGIRNRWFNMPISSDITVNGDIVRGNATPNRFYEIEGVINLESTSSSTNVKSATINIEITDGTESTSFSIPFEMTTGSLKMPLHILETVESPDAYIGMGDFEIVVSVSNLNNLKVVSTSKIRFKWLRDTEVESEVTFIDP